MRVTTRTSGFAGIQFVRNFCISTAVVVLVLVQSALPAASETELTEQFIRRLVEPAIEGRPFDLTGMQQTSEPPYTRYTDVDAGFFVQVLQEGNTTTAISLGIVDGDKSWIRTSKEVRRFAAFSITKEMQLHEFIAEFDSWLAEAQDAYAAECVPQVTGEKQGDGYYQRAVKFVTADGKPGFVSFDANKRFRTFAGQKNDTFFTFGAMLVIGPGKNCLADG